MKRLVTFLLIAAAVVALASCKEKIDIDGGGGSGNVYTDDVDNLTSTSARLHGHFKSENAISGDNVGFICDKVDKFKESSSPRESSAPDKDGKFYATFSSLSPNTEYAYMAYAKFGSKVEYGKKKTFKTEGIPVTKITVSPTEVKILMEVSKTSTLTVKVEPDEASDKSVSFESNDKSIATVSDKGVITGVKGGQTTIKISSVSNPSVSTTCKVIVKDVPPDGAVDMGLPSGRYWHRYNLDATSTSGTGGFYAWAETSTKTNYTENNYKFKASGKIMYSKYQGSYSNYGEGDKMYYLSQDNYVDDAARQKLGGTWRIPSEADFKELCSNCTITKSSAGLTFKAKNKSAKGTYNELFFPFSGYKFETSLQYPDQSVYGTNQGFYWCDEVRYRWYNDSPDNFSALCYRLCYGSAVGAGSQYKYRYFGMMIRPVCD